MFEKKYLSDELKNDLKKVNELLQKITEKVINGERKKDEMLKGGKEEEFVEARNIIINATKLYEEMGKQLLILKHATPPIKLPYEKDIETIVDMVENFKHA